MKKLSRWVSSNSNAKVALLFLIIFLVFTSTVLPDQSKKAEAYSAGVGSVDLQLWYSGEEVYEIAEAYGVEGRLAYVQARMSFDVVWPIVYMLFLATSISYVFQKAFDETSSLQLFNLSPIVGLVFDYFENGIASIVMLRFPIQLIFLSNILPVFTLIKWVFVMGSFVVLLYGIGAWIIKLFIHKKILS